MSSIQETYDRLRAAFASGRTRPVSWRRTQLTAIRRFINENRETLIEAVRLDLGHGPTTPVITEILGPLDELAHQEEHLDEWLKPQPVSLPGRLQPATGYLVREPLGIVLIISPWNYPLNLCLMPLIGAIAAGNCCILKPSEVAEHTADAISRLLPRYLDHDAFAVVAGGVEETTALLKLQFDHVFYTGNGTVGRIVMEAAAKHLTPVTLELGGKSPVYVDKHVNLDVAAKRITWGKFMNCGQTCIAPDYLMVHKDIKDAFVQKVVETIAAFYGADPRKSKDYSRIINSRHTSRLQRVITAPGNGTLVTGGQVDVDGRYIQPTVFKDVPLTSELMKEELFGPIMPIISTGSAEEFIAVVSSRPKPLALYIFTEDPAVVDKIVGNTSAGGVCVNETIMHVAAETLPFGGVGPSGMGAYHGKHSFDTFTHAKPVLNRAVWMDPAARYPPYPSNMVEQMEKLTALLKALPTAARLAGLAAVVGVVLRAKL